MVKWIIEMLCDSKFIYKVTVVTMAVFLYLKIVDTSSFAIIQIILLNLIDNNQMECINHFIIPVINGLSRMNCILWVLALVSVWWRNERKTQTINNITKDLCNCLSIISCIILIIFVLYDFVIRNYGLIVMDWSVLDYCKYPLIYLLACSPFLLRFCFDVQDIFWGKEIEDDKPSEK